MFMFREAPVCNLHHGASASLGFNPPVNCESLTRLQNTLKSGTFVGLIYLFFKKIQNPGVRVSSAVSQLADSLV